MEKSRKVKITCTFELSLKTNLNENQLKDRIYSVINEFHAEKGGTSEYFDQEEIEESELVDSKITF
jgi:hypothetical protein